MAKTQQATKASKAKSTMNPPQQSSMGFVLVIAAVVVLGLGAVAFLVTNRSEGEATAEAGEQVAEITVDGDPLSAMPPSVGVTDPSSDPSFGQVAPTLTGTTFDDVEVTIGPDGSPKVIYFLAHWCPHCQREVPQVQNLINGGSVPDDLEIYAVSTSVDATRGNFPVSRWLENEGFTPTVIRDDAASSALLAYGAGGFPYAVYLDGENRVLARSSGELGSGGIQQLWEATAASVG